MRQQSLTLATCLILCLSPVVLGQARGAPSTPNTSASTLANPQQPVTIQLVQPPTPARTGIETYAPYIVAFVGLLGVFATAVYTIYRGKLDARYAYASEMLKFRVRQVEEFYAPALLHIEQSRIVYEKLKWTLRRERPDIRLEEFRLLDYIYEFKHNNTPMQPLVDEILAIGSALTKLLSEHSGLIDGGVNDTFIDYQGHFKILKAAGEQQLGAEHSEGWHEMGYYTRLLNREIREGYKAVLAHLDNYATASDKVIGKLLGRKIETEKFRLQLMDNLRFYERQAKSYAAKFDKFDLSAIRDRFVEEIEKTRGLRPQAFANGQIKILDAGCGTGRDAYEFIRRGYVVTAIDASPAMLRICRNKISDAAENAQNDAMKDAASRSVCLEKTFDEIAFRSEFDGVWAAASLLHVPSQQMKDTIATLIRASKPDGILYMSLKYGAGEHEYDARSYSYYGRRRVVSLLRKILGATISDIWLTDPNGNNLSVSKQRRAWLLELCGRYDRTIWLNVLVQRKRRS